MNAYDKAILDAIDALGIACTVQIFDYMVSHGTIEPGPNNKNKVSGYLSTLVKYRFIAYKEVNRRRYYHRIENIDPAPVLVGCSLMKISDFIDGLAPGSEIDINQASKVAGCSVAWARRILNAIPGVKVTQSTTGRPAKYYTGA